MDESRSRRRTSASVLRSVPGEDATATSPARDAWADLLDRSARGDVGAFEQLYDGFAGAVLGLTTRVVRDRSLAEEVTQEVFVDVWRLAAHFDDGRGSARAWIMTIAHRRAVDRVRHEQSAAERDRRVAAEFDRPHDEVAERAETGLQHEQVRRCLDALTDLQRESITLAYYGGYSYPEVATLLHSPLGTIKTRMRDGLIRLRDCLGVGR